MTQTILDYILPMFAGAVIGLLIVGAAAGLWWLWWVLPRRHAEKMHLRIRDAKARADVEDAFRKTITQLLGGIAVLLGTGVAYVQLSQQHDQARLQAKASRDLLISNQIAKSFELLGSDKMMSRIGGVYALENIMNTSKDYHFSILESLTAFVRMQSQATPAVAEDVQAAMLVIGRRNAQINDNPDLRGAKLAGASLYLANLVKANLTGADLQSANLGHANLSWSDMTGVRLVNADLTWLDMTDAKLAHADFTGANFKSAILDFADLTESNVTQAQLDLACGYHTKLPPGMKVRDCGKDDRPDYSLDPADRE